MDYEKKYKDAIQRAKHALDCDRNNLVSTDVPLIYSMFPELRESEDERIRKALIDGFTVMKESKNCGKTFSNHNIPVVDILAWLEKQGEVESDNDDIEVEEKGIREAFNKIEDEKQCKQKPQRVISAEAKEAMYNKPADKVEPKCEESKTKIFDAPTPFEDKLYVFVSACEFLAIPSKIEFILEHSQELLDAAKEQIGKERKPTWSEEDERKIQDCIDAVSRVNLFKVYYQNELVGWLKSLKTKVQPKQEWSEKDEEELEIAIDTLKESGRYDSAKWVQSLKQRIGG